MHAVYTVAVAWITNSHLEPVLPVTAPQSGEI